MEVARIGEIANTKPIPKIPTNPKTRWIFLYMRKLLQGGLNGYVAAGSADSHNAGGFPYASIWSGFSVEPISTPGYPPEGALWILWLRLVLNCQVLHRRLMYDS